LANKDKKEVEVKKAAEVKKEETKIVKEYKEEIDKYDHLKRVNRDLPDQKKRNKEDKVGSRSILFYLTFSLIGNLL
jgi:hypothetical protein